MRIVQWHDKRVISVLSTLHDDSLVTVERRSRQVQGGRQQVEKPEAIVEHNRYMGGLDRGDQLLSYYGYHIMVIHTELGSGGGGPCFFLLMLL